MPTDVVKTVYEGGDRASAQRWYLSAFLVDAGWTIQDCVTVPVLVMKTEASEFKSYKVAFIFPGFPRSDGAQARLGVWKAGGND
jgi:hypothetical protein